MEAVTWSLCIPEGSENTGVVVRLLGDSNGGLRDDLYEHDVVAPQRGIHYHATLTLIQRAFECV